MSPDFTSLYPLLNNCLYIDQIRLRNRINKVKNIKDNSRKEISYLELQGQVTEAQQRLTNRENQKVLLSYPENLPVSQQASSISEAIKNNQVVIVAGETGSGKTTQLPKICLEAGLGVVLCCGENLNERDAGIQQDVIKKQLESALNDVKDVSMKSVVIAYEPIWAIGTGRTASADQAAEMHTYIRSWLSLRFDEQTANSTSILYGGSCKPSNAEELFSKSLLLKSSSRPTKISFARLLSDCTFFLAIISSEGNIL